MPRVQPVSLSHDIVADAFVETQVNMEGWLPYMYLDRLGFVTTGMGDLIDPPTEALVLPWKKKGTSVRASGAEIMAEWQKIKARKDLISPIGGSVFAPLTTLELSKADIGDLVHKRFLANEAVLAKRYPNYTAMPAPAQTALHSIAWGTGPNYRAAELDRALLQPTPDFEKASKEGQFHTFAPDRRAAIRRHFLDAAEVQKSGGDYAALPSSDVGCCRRSSMGWEMPSLESLPLRLKSVVTPDRMIRYGLIGGASILGVVLLASLLATHSTSSSSVSPRSRALARR